MIEYRYDEEKITAYFFADLFGDKNAKKILDAGVVTNNEEAIYLSQFFWRMAKESGDSKAKGTTLEIPCEGSTEYWLEKLYNTFGGYLESAGYSKEWDTEINNA